MEKEQERQWRQEIRKQLEKEEQRKRAEEEKRDREQLTRLEYLRKEKIRKEEEEKFYASKGFVKIKNRYGEAKWVSPEEAGARKKHKRKRSSKKSKIKSGYIVEMFVFIIAVLILFFTYKYFKNRHAGPVKRGDIIVLSTSPGAKIFLNGKFTNRYTPDTLKGLKQGSYWVSVDKQGFEEIPNFRTVKLSSGKQLTVNFEIRNTVKKVSVTVEGIVPPFEYYVDGNYEGNSDNGTISLPFGIHYLKPIKKGSTVKPSGKWITVNEKLTSVRFTVENGSAKGKVRITSNVSDALIFVNKKNFGIHPSVYFFELEPGTYDLRLVHPDYIFTPLSKIVKLGRNHSETLVITGQPVHRYGKLYIDNCTMEPLSIDGRLQPYLCGQDTMELTEGRHFIAVIDQTTGAPSKRGTVKIERDSLNVFSWNSRFGKWNRINNRI